MGATLSMLISGYVRPAAMILVEANLVPAVGLNRVKAMNTVQQQEATSNFIKEIKNMPIAIKQDKANEQHYELPAPFFEIVLGPCLKYSSGYWPNERTTLPESEVEMLELYCKRAGLQDGMNIIDLGCGWGSVTLYLASKYPNSTIVSISNSTGQRNFINNTAAKRGLGNIQVFSGDISSFDLPAIFTGRADRVISIEMFEHMKNYGLLLEKICTWLKPGGKLFVHIFTHTVVPEHFEKGWMAEKFFSGGTLPSDDLLLYFQQHLQIEDHWRVNGTHYQRTLEAWLVLMDANRDTVMDIMKATYGATNAVKWFVNWRLFFIACAEFFGTSQGEEYIVSHYLFTKPLH